MSLRIFPAQWPFKDRPSLPGHARTSSPRLLDTEGLDQVAIIQFEGSEVAKGKPGRHRKESRTERDHFGPSDHGPGVPVLLPQDYRLGQTRESGLAQGGSPRVAAGPESPRHARLPRAEPTASARGRGDPHRPAVPVRPNATRRPRTCPSWGPRRRARGARPPPTPAARPRAAPRPRPRGASPPPRPRRARRPSPRPGRRRPAAAPAGTPC